MKNESETAALRQLEVLAEDLQKMYRDGEDARDMIAHIQSVVYKAQTMLSSKSKVTFLPELFERFISKKEMELAEAGYNID